MFDLQSLWLTKNDWCECWYEKETSMHIYNEKLICEPSSSTNQQVVINRRHTWREHDKKEQQKSSHPHHSIFQIKFLDDHFELFLYVFNDKKKVFSPLLILPEIEWSDVSNLLTHTCRFFFLFFFFAVYYLSLQTRILYQICMKEKYVISMMCNETRASFVNEFNSWDYVQISIN